METVRNIQNPIPPGLLKPSKWLSLYEDFVTKNASSVGQVESALRSLTYIIPGESPHPGAWICGKVINSPNLLGRYRESEIPSECG
jgi:peroxin-16